MTCLVIVVTHARPTHARRRRLPLGERCRAGSQPGSTPPVWVSSLPGFPPCSCYQQHTTAFGARITSTCSCFSPVEQPCCRPLANAQTCVLTLSARAAQLPVPGTTPVRVLAWCCAAVCCQRVHTGTCAVSVPLQPPASVAKQPATASCCRQLSIRHTVGAWLALSRALVVRSAVRGRQRRGGGGRSGEGRMRVVLCVLAVCLMSLVSRGAMCTRACGQAVWHKLCCKRQRV
jgi:hypothetical protein